MFAVPDRATQAREVSDRLNQWVSDESAVGRRSLRDLAEFDERLLIAQVVYDDVDAPSEWDAEVDGRAMFRDQAIVDQLPEAETLVAHAELMPAGSSARPS